MPDLSDLADASDASRQDHIVAVLVDAFEHLIERDPRAFRGKFRKMAADPFAFYRGSAALFYSDVARLDDPWVDDATSRVWIQGDLHAENYGTYMDSAGVLVFDVNDFDEAYLGHYTWDLQRMAASVALLGFRKALSDASIGRLIETYARAYVQTVRLFATSEVDRDFRLTLDNTEGPLRTVLQTARLATRLNLLDVMTAIEDGDRRLALVPEARELDQAEKDAVLGAYAEYLDTIPEAKRQHSISYEVKDIVGRSGFGIGSAGLRAYTLLVEGRTQALENDVVLSMKQAQTPAVSRIVRDERIRAYFEHEGHRTAVSQGALQAHADPWVGWCSLDGVGQVIKELSPYEADLNWDAVTEMDELIPLVRDLGRATAKVHCVSDVGNEHPLVDVNVEAKISAVIGDREDEFAASLAAWGADYGRLAREDHRRFVDAFRNGMIRGVESD
ncbi:DUF2252 domain-containing protein [Solirubrobacter ginsenosidimutans]|uniref:DUF2252 domain-containing protein n=1 Tax=Solirubrobacter ginsenosidimutans TaxID=490573 RepID=A0A9X3N5S3_9ACTN|nr:DUF2252 domain-containing protein [Solirubrobacter ginsenosidimutans]MDA0165383.1 DUF2252 domain-containing protein [Solirubrobacter ginsenosidimutans]